jgi:tRNA threonylcarbamoyladenosine biosynthesis protein TsaE
LPVEEGIEMPRTIVTKTERETEELGERIGKRLRPGETVLLCGGLGSGKTAMARGIARGLGSEDRVQSPTFTIANEYPMQGGKLVHMDLYRLSRDDFEELGLQEYWDGKNVIVIEWPDKMGIPAADCTLLVTLKAAPQGTQREILLDGGAGDFRWKGIENADSGNRY